MMTTAISVLSFLLVLLALAAAVLGGLGVFGLGQDSRGLDTRPHSDELSSRALLS